MNERLTICACQNRRLVSTAQVEALASQARADGCQVEVVADLCALLQEGDADRLQQLQGQTIAACHERAVRSLLRWRGLAARRLVNLREGQGLPGPGNDAWYPVIDKDRCTECGKCHDFCPFGVYELVDDRVSVVHPQKCKNNCPSCARGCPSEAIIFPKYGYSPINGGVEHEEQLRAGDASSVLYADAFRARLMERRSQGTPLFKLKQ